MHRQTKIDLEPFYFKRIKGIEYECIGAPHVRFVGDHIFLALLPDERDEVIKLSWAEIGQIIV